MKHLTSKHPCKKTQQQHLCEHNDLDLENLIANYGCAEVKGSDKDSVVFVQTSSSVAERLD